MASYNDYLSSLQSYNQPVQVPMFNSTGNFQAAAPSYATLANFTKRPDTLSAGTAGLSDYLQGATSSFASGDLLGGLKDIGSGIGNLLPEGFLSTTKDGIKTDGWGGMALGALQSGFGAYGAMKNYGLAKDAFNLQKEVAMTNLNANKKATNTRYEDRQRARVASGSGYESVDSYMNKNRIV